MPHARRLATLLLMLFVSACSTITASTNYDPQAVGKLGAYRTYAWLPMREGADPAVYNPIVGKRVMDTVDRELASRGYRRVDPNQNPDFKIGWHGALEHKLDVNTVNYAYGYTWGGWYAPYHAGMAVGGAGVPYTSTYEYQQGTLILDVVDTPTNELVWRGTAQAELSENPSNEQRQGKMTKAVHKVFENFPPQPKK